VSHNIILKLQYQVLQTRKSQKKLTLKTTSTHDAERRQTRVRRQRRQASA